MLLSHMNCLLVFIYNEFRFFVRPTQLGSYSCVNRSALFDSYVYFISASRTSGDTFIAVVNDSAVDFRFSTYS